MKKPGNRLKDGDKREGNLICDKVFELGGRLLGFED